MSRAGLALLVVGGLLLMSCSGETRPPVLGDLLDSAAEFSRMRYRGDGAISLNDRCPVQHSKLSPAIAPRYVNGRPIGFC